MCAIPHRAAAADGAPIVVDRSVAASCVMLVGPGPHRASHTADLSLVVDDRGAAAAGTAAVRLASQFAAAADVVVVIVHHTVAATVRVEPKTATCILTFRIRQIAKRYA